jgi:hypothetical protein
MSKTALMFVRVVLIVLTATTCAYSADATSWLQMRVCRFIFRGRSFHGGRHHSPIAAPGGIIEAVRQLAWHAEAPICIEALRSLPGETVVPIEIDVRNVSVKEILGDMVSQDPRYVYRERFGVVEVLPQGADRAPADCLNMVIPAFRLRDEWNSLIQQLRCEVDIVSRDPKAVVPYPGCGGSYPGLAHPPPGLIEANFENRTVRDILDLLCAKVGNMAWTADFNNPPQWSSDHEEKRTPSPLSCHDMSISVYQPRRWSPSDTVPLTWSKGLPKTCLKCHYHQPCPAK